jgi:hypothetical protein
MTFFGIGLLVSNTYSIKNKIIGYSMTTNYICTLDAGTTTVILPLQISSPISLPVIPDTSFCGRYINIFYFYGVNNLPLTILSPHPVYLLNFPGYMPPFTQYKTPSPNLPIAKKQNFTRLVSVYDSTTNIFSYIQIG